MSIPAGPSLLGSLALDWRSKAKLFREHEQAATAVAYEICAAALEEALRSEDETLLNLTEAAEVSGYSADHLGRLVREGKIPNRGRPGAPKIARGDLPMKRGVGAETVALSGSRGQISRTAVVRSAIARGVG